MIPIRPSTLGPILARFRLHRFQLRIGPDGVPLIAKRRRWWARLVIPPGNLYLRRPGAKVEILDERAWHDRERAFHQGLYGIDCPTDSRGWLVLPRWPGLTLDRFAADRGRSADERCSALTAAGSALLRLHRVRLDGSGPLSHGDATLRNVQYDPATGRAAWFDLDTAHRPEMPADSRHADDLRALLCSALAVAADLPVADLVGAVRAAYVEPDPWRLLGDMTQSGPIHFSTFHLAQARPTPERLDELEAILGRS